MENVLKDEYEQIIEDFKTQNELGTGEVKISSMVSELDFLKEERANEGLLSWYYTKNEGDNKLIVHLYCYDRCRVNQVNPDGNKVTVTLNAGGDTKSEVFVWLDKY